MAASSKKSKTTMQRYVPPDLIRVILLHLPCKSLIRFRTVCNLFDSFVGDLQFIIEHSKRNTKPSHYLTWDTRYETKFHVFDLSENKHSHIKTVEKFKDGFPLQSCCGLVCLLGWDGKSIALLNPLSEELTPLPDLPMLYRPESRNNPQWCADGVGFGFDVKTQKYKFVQLVTYILYRRAVSRCYVLTLGGTWRRVAVSNESTGYFMWNPIYVDGVLYWEVVSPFHGLIVEVLLLVFDLSTEKMNVMESPVKYRSGTYAHRKHLTSLEEKLCCVDLSPPVDMSLTMTIWKLEGGVHWISWYRLEIYNPRPGVSTLYPIYIDGKKRIICQGPGDLYCYDIENKSLEIFPVSEKVEGAALYSYTNLAIIHSEYGCKVIQG